MAVRKIAHPDSESPRVETGAIQFGEDWPGLFIRGDQALHLALFIGWLEPFIKALLERQEMPTLGPHDWDHLDMALSAITEMRRVINDEVRA